MNHSRIARRASASKRSRAARHDPPPAGLRSRARDSISPFLPAWSRRTGRGAAEVVFIVVILSSSSRKAESRSSFESPGLGEEHFADDEEVTLIALPENWPIDSIDYVLWPCEQQDAGAVSRALVGWMVKLVFMSLVGTLGNDYGRMLPCSRKLRQAFRDASGIFFATPGDRPCVTHSEPSLRSCCARSLPYRPWRSRPTRPGR